MRVATFNLNNLFDSFNFAVRLEELPSRDAIAAAALQVAPQEHEGDVDDPERLGRPELDPRGRLVQPKAEQARQRLAERIATVDADVMLVQEVEHRDALREFNQLPAVHGGLGGRYRWLACIDGNDRRRIDVGVLTKLPLGGVTSWQHVEHPDARGEPIFSRDLLEIDILTDDFSDVRLTCFVTHLKSHHIPWEPDQTDADREQARNDADQRRERQADMIARILERRQLGRPHIVAGDMNDSPEAHTMRPLRDAPSGLIDALTNVTEDPPYALPEEDPPPNVRWTHRYREHGLTSYELFDHLWLDAAHENLLEDSGIQRRRFKAADGSDHDPAWIDLSL